MLSDDRENGVCDFEELSLSDGLIDGDGELATMSPWVGQGRTNGRVDEAKEVVERVAGLWNDRMSNLQLNDPR